MSLTEVTNGHDHTDGVRIYRGRSLVELIPQIRTELGPDAVILREREGLVGGVNGFFAKRFVEVQARAGNARVDVYADDEDFEDEPELTPAPQPQVGTFSGNTLDSFHPSSFEEPSFAETLAQAAAIDEPEPIALEEPEAVVAPEPEAVVAPEPEAVVAPAPEPEPLAAPQPPAPDHAGIALELTSKGISSELAAQLLHEATVHGSPFAPGASLRDAVRSALARRLPTAPVLPAGGAAVAFVGAGGAGKTRATAAFARSYHVHSPLGATAFALGATDNARAITSLLKPERVTLKRVKSAASAAKSLTSARNGGVAVIDTPGVASANQAAVQALAAELGRLSLDATFVALPATLSAPAARQLLAGLQPLRPTGIVVTHADETDQLGVALELACATGTPIAYVHAGLDLTRALSAPDPFRLASWMLP